MPDTHQPPISAPAGPASALGLAAPSASAVPVSLPTSLDLTWADRLHEDMRTRIAHRSDLLIDAAAVDQVSTACLQVLGAAAASARLHGLAFRLAAPSIALREAARDLGLGQALGLEEE